MSGLPRADLLALVAAANRRTPLEAAARKDPYLQKRLDDAATLARWEERLRKAAIRALGQWTTVVRTAVLDGRMQLVADAEGGPAGVELPPDPNAIASLGPAWDQIAQATVVTSVGDLLGEVFGQYTLTGDGVISARAWQAEHLATVSNRLSGIPDQTFDRVRVGLQEGYDKGESIPHLRDRVLNLLSPRVGGGSNYWRNRATVIARTETTGAMNGGHMAAWRAMAKATDDAGLGDTTGGDGEGGSGGLKIWVATMDERTRPSHVAADGMQRPMNKPFDLMGGPLDYPGDAAGPASETVNCRCTVMYLGDGDSIPNVGERQLGQDTEGYRDGVAETSAAEDAAAAEEEAAADAEIAAETDAETGDVLAEADADAGAGDPETPAEEADGAPRGEEVTAEGEQLADEPDEQNPETPTAGAPAQATADRMVTASDATTGADTDAAGVPWRLTYDYLSGLDEEALDNLSDYLAEGLGSDDPLEGARWDDFEKYLDHQEREDRLVNDLSAVRATDVEINRAVEEFQRTEGVPGLTHPDVGGWDTTGLVPTRAQVQDEFATFLEEQYLRAEQATRGHLLTPTAQAKGISPRSLFGGSFKGGIREVVRYASEELLEFWENEPRVSWAEFYYERTGNEKFADAAAKAARNNAGIARDRANPLTAAASSSRLTSGNTARPAVLPAAASSRVDEPSDAQRIAYAAGRDAYTAGAPSTACPHPLGVDVDPDGLGRLWVRGYVQARRDHLAARAVAAGLLTPAGQLAGGPRQLTAAPQTPAPAGTDDPAGASTSTPSEGSTMPPRTWRSDPFLAPFAVPTGDGRIFAVGSLTNRELPLPLLFQDSSAPGHDQSVVVGRILEVNFTGEGIVAAGDYLDDPAVADVVGKAIALTEAGLGHVSVDLAACTGELVDEAGNPVAMDQIFDAWDRGEDPVVLEQVTKGELIATTQVATPAFGVGAKIAMSDSGAGQAVPAPVVIPAIEAAVEGDQVASMTDSAGNTLMPGDVVEVTLPAGDNADDSAPADQEAAPVADNADTVPADEDDGTAPTKVKGRITNLDPKTEKITVQPDDETAEPLVVGPDDVTKVNTDPKPADGDPADNPVSQGAAIDGAQTFDVAEAIGTGVTDPTAAPADAGEESGEPDEVAAVTAATDLALLEAVAPHYDAAAKLVTEAFASLTDERVKALATDLVEDAAEWTALLNYGLTPDDDDSEGLLASALVAAAGPMNPPAAWFDNPNLTAPTALTITDDGRVYGHAATWGTCHVGFSKTCVTPPPSPSSYAYFHTGEVVCADGSRVAVGNLTLGGRHADVELAYRSAIEHYDVQGAGVAVVRMYEDEHGIAFAGALTPGINDGQLYDLRRSPVSGDWRRVGGNLELIGVLSVNAPGFPTPRFRTDDSGRTALTAAPSVRPAMGPKRLRTRAGAGLNASQLSAAIQAQISKEVVAEMGRQHSAEQRRRRLQVATVAIKGEPRARMAALAASVDGGRASARRDRLAELAGMVG